MTEKQDIHHALAQLDVGDDAHWTSDGSPRLDAVASILGHKVTRQELVDAAPGFHRDAKSPAAQDEEKGEYKPSREDPKSVKDGEREYLEVSQKILDLQEKKAVLEDEIRDLAFRQSALQRFAPQRGYDSKADQQARMDFIKSQNQIRRQRAGNVMEAVKKLAASASKAPIDQAFEKDASKDRGRPTRAPVGQQAQPQGGE